ncbi:MAG: NAD(P)H-binding protein [Micrococcales bacterium]|nr:NAD(P)H-binding protein [Micrococcales bacterium]MCL2667112.1 NAD(P)H-binding protein [Micrococcales bacterium]
MTTALITGTNGYTGRHLAHVLIERGRQVRTLTRDPATVTPPIDALPFTFDDPERLTAAFDGIDTFYNTYWVRFARRGASHDLAVAHSRALITAAARAGVRRMVHISIMNPDPDSPYTYQRGKAIVEDLVRASGMSYAILRPSVLFGGAEVLLNNVAWLLRHFPVFTVPGDGRYPIRPTHVDDLAELMAALAAGDDNVERNAGGPETFAFGDLVRLIGKATGARARVVDAPRALVLPATRVVARITGDVTVTRAELDALMDGLASCDGPPAGKRRYTDFLIEHGLAYGRTYTHELRRNFTSPAS